MNRKKFDLGGIWQYRVPDGEYTERKVPGSYLCVGQSEYTRHFSLLPQAGKRTFLCTEGINYEGTVIVNGITLGKTLPYCHYEFDITDYLKEDNELTVLVKDIYAPFGFMAGWCCYGGIIREIYLEERAETYLDDVWFRNTLTEDFLRADATVEIAFGGCMAENLSTTATLFRNGATVAVAKGDKHIAFSVERPVLWSPDDPALYELTVTLEKDGVAIDTRTMEVGFRSLTMDDKRFYLNGEPFFIVGVCRHDLGTLDEGHTLTDEAIERDMRMIKELGANFVRLVHYPHDTRVLRIADRIGLMVSEEPGLWWSDLKDKATTDGALEVLKRTIIRDRSHACVAFWMSFNECVFTQEFLNDAVKVSRTYDPDRYSSGANCMDVEMTREMFNIADIDFYTMHPYGMRPERVAGKKGGTSLDVLFREYAGKPLIFTEWGGYYVVDNPALFTDFCNKMKRGKEKGLLAGMLYWAFADMYEFNRADACIDGVQFEGLVTIDRRPKENYYVLQKFIRELSLPANPVKFAMEAEVASGTETVRSTPIALPPPENDPVQNETWQQACEDARMTWLPTQFENLRMRRKRYFKVGPILPTDCDRVGNLDFYALRKPIAIGEKTSICSVPVNRSGRQLVLLGNVIFMDGYPIAGERGEVCATLTLCYADGEEKQIPLRNGYELLTVNRTFLDSYIDPTSPILKPAVSFSYDKGHDNYRIYTLEIELCADRVLESFSIQSEMTKRPILLYGATLI